MKTRISLFLGTLFLVFQGFSQCLPDRHSTSWFDNWISCEASENPNKNRDESHWISYDLGKLYKLGELKIWNLNAPDLLENGAKTIVIDYSKDGDNWTEYGEVSLDPATGKNTYEGETILDFAEIEAKYILFTITENYGGNCYGFAEMKVEAEPAEDENEDVCILADIFPNPTSNNFSVYLRKKCLGDAYLSIEDATGRTVIDEEIIQLYDTKAIRSENLNAGVYFVVIRNGEVTARFKVVKN